ncbi:MAG: hypothetical protein Q7R35_03845 [Elusimicrobiota bacterium]|nr:hypothetical protein [Elusimicrobiota bacterium]
MKILKLVLAAAVAACISCPAAWAVLTAGGVGALDGSGNQRTTFTNVETIALRQVVNNSEASDSRIQFKFTIYNPSGGAVFRHEGNSAGAVPGNSNSQISGLAISRFYNVPGIYKFRAEAVLGAQTVVQEVSFQISSPNINLIYPPYGARGLTDKPLTFRWVASGASTYKIAVADNAGLYNPVHEGNASAGMYTYPENPTGPLEQLVADKVYYWKVTGLDPVGMKIAESTVYSFSLKSLASSQSRNIAVTTLELTDSAIDFKVPLHFRTVVKNIGGTNETSIAIKMSLSGMPAQDSPKNIGMLGAGDSQEILFTAFMPAGQEEGLAVACVDIFDDNIPDNCKTKLIAKSTGGPGIGGGSAETRKLTYQEIWEEVVKRLGPDASRALEGYTFDSIECGNCTAGELNDAIMSLMDGSAKLTGAAVSDSYPPTQALVVPGQAAPEEQDATPEEESELEMDIAAPDKAKDAEWSGYSNSIKSKEPAFYTIKGQKEWEKTWETLSSEEAPKVEFAEKTIIGIVAGTGNKADSVRIIARRQLGDATVFDYYMTEAAGDNPAVPYLFRTFGKVEGKVEFKRIDVGGK